MLRVGKQLQRHIDEYVFDSRTAGCEVAGSSESMYMLVRAPLVIGKATKGLTPDEHHFLKKQVGAIAFESTDGRRAVTYYPGNESWTEDPAKRLEHEWSVLVSSYAELEATPDGSSDGV